MPDSLPPEMVFEESSTRLAGDGYPSTSKDPVRYFGASPWGLPVWPPEESVVLGYQLSEKNWVTGEAEPEEWPEPTLLETVNLAGLTFESLGRYETSSVTVDEEAVETSNFYRRKWRFAWLVPSSETAWKFVHLRYRRKLIYTVSGTVGEVEVEVSPTVDFWWKGAVPLDYSASNPLTWPGTEWVETPLPPPPSTPPDTVAAHRYVFEWVWPIPAWVTANPVKTAGAFQYPGFIPGTIGPTGEMAKPVVVPP